MTTGVLNSVIAPSRWGWQELWTVAPRIKETGRPDLPPLSVYLELGVVPRSSRDDNRNQLGEDLSRYLVVQPNDVVFNKLRTWQGGLGVSQHTGIVSPAYFVCRPSNSVHSRYLHYLLRSDPYLAELTRISKWMPPSQFDTPWEQLRKLPILTPPLEEQRRIADFLNIETGRIDQLIRLRERQVHLIEERCVSALGHAFSKKAYRPTRLKYLLLNRPRYGVLVPQFSDDGVRFIRVNDLLNLQGRADSLSRIPQSLSAQYTRTVTKPGDVLLSVVGTMGRSAVVPAELAGSNVARAVASLRPLPNVPAELLSTWLTTPEFLRQATEATGSDTAQPTLGMEDLANFELAWPMPGRDQDELLAATRRLQEQRNDLVRVFRRQSQLFNERRRALITAAVTGQFDVTTASGRNVTEGVAV